MGPAAQLEACMLFINVANSATCPAPNTTQLTQGVDMYVPVGHQQLLQ